jgi:DNA repair photolyase
MNWNKTHVKNTCGEIVRAQAPVIISASRSTDIPAFYSDWLINRIKEGFVKWKNPFNGVPLYVSFEKARLFVFWSKNHEPILKHLDFLDEKGYNYYFQFTLNDYDTEKLEPQVPAVQSRIETFIKLSERVGKEKVIWRFDPLILTDKINVEELLKKTENIGNQLKDYTDKLVFSFADIKLYNKVQNNLRRNSIPYQEFDELTMNEYASGLQLLNKKWNFELATCAEKIVNKTVGEDWKTKYGINSNKCIDDDLMIRLFLQDKVLMDFLGVKITQKQPTLDFPDTNDNGAKIIIEKTKENKDKGQRKFCGCIMSKDIGEYNTCQHLCEYCYASASKEIVLKNWLLHKQSPNSETIKGE